MDYPRSGIKMILKHNDSLSWCIYLTYCILDYPPCCKLYHQTLIILQSQFMGSLTHMFSTLEQ